MPENAVFKKPKEISFPTDYYLRYDLKVLNTLIEMTRMNKSVLRVLHISKKGEELSEEQLKNKEFLNDYSTLKPSKEDKDNLVYMTPDINWSDYNSIMVDKVLIITPDGEQKTDGQLLVAIADKFEALIKQNVSKQFQVVDVPGDGTIRLQAAITGVYSSYNDMKGYQYIPIAAAVTGVKRGSGKEKQSARVMAEFKLVDSVDGQLLAQGIDLKAGKEKQNKDSEILLADVVPILEQWSKRVTDRLLGLRNSVK